MGWKFFLLALFLFKVVRILNKTSAWYPQGSKIKNFAYVESLKKDNNELYTEAKNLLAAAHENIKITHIKKSFEGLKQLKDRERNAEKKWFEDLGITIDWNNSDDEISELIQLFNKVLNDESIYRDSIQRIKNTIEQKNESLNLFYTTFNYSISDFLKEQTELFLKDNSRIRIDYMGEDFVSFIEQPFKDFIWNIFKNSYSSESEKEKKTYDDLLKFLEEDVRKNKFLDDIFSQYFKKEKFIDELREAREQTKNNKKAFEEVMYKRHSGKGRVKRAGGSYEVVVDALLNKAYTSLKKGLKDGKKDGFTFSVEQTGGLNEMKADNIVINLSEIDFDFSKMFNDFKDNTIRSRRIQNIEAIGQVLDKIKDKKGEMVFVSDKSYNLSGEFFKKEKGFSAEAPNLLTIKSVLGKAGANQEAITDLIYILMNSGGDGINKNNIEDAKYFLSGQIGNFLFDDVVITEELDKKASNINRIHLFNLNGIFIPLSVFLEGAYNAFYGLTEEVLADYVKINFSLSAINPNEKAREKDWKTFAYEKKKNTKMEIHFFGDFVNFIIKHIKF